MRQTTMALAFLSTTLLISCGRTTPTLPENDNVPEEVFPTVIPADDGTYFPTTVGAKWVYERIAGPNPGVSTFVVTKVEDKEGAKFVTRGRITKNGEVTNLVTWKIAPDGQYVLRMVRDVPNQSVLELKLPHVDGNTWEDGLYKAHREVVTVPAGTFKAIRVTNSFDSRTEWYAPGIGLVRSVYRDPWPPERPIGHTETVLKAFRP